VGYAWVSNYGCSDNEKDFRQEQFLSLHVSLYRYLIVELDLIQYSSRHGGFLTEMDGSVGRSVADPGVKKTPDPGSASLVGIAPNCYASSLGSNPYIWPK